MRKLLRLARNLWILRRQLLQRYGLRRPQPIRTAELRCLRCGRPLTKPCRPRHRAHTVKIPDGFPAAGEIVYVAQTKAFRPATDVRREPF